MSVKYPKPRLCLAAGLRVRQTLQKLSQCMGTETAFRDSQLLLHFPALHIASLSPACEESNI
jgi:hypothetical protein